MPVTTPRGSPFSAIHTDVPYTGTPPLARPSSPSRPSRRSVSCRTGDRRAGTMDPTTTRAASTVCRLRRASLPVTHREYGRHMALFHRRHRAPPYRPTGSLDIRPFPRCPCPWAVAGGPCTRTLPCPVPAEQPFTRTARFTFQNPPESLPHPPRSCVRKQASLRRTTASPPCQCRFLRAAQA